MKYAEALTNLHKSGIDKNSTPQEIAAASVGTKLDKNGKPIISNVTQGQNYGKALGNITPSVNKNPSGVKPNANNNTNTNTTNNKLTTVVTNVETKSIKAKATENNNTIQTNNSNKSSKYDEYKVSNALPILAAKNAKIKTNSRGEPIINSASDAKRYMDEYNRLKKNESQIIAAAAAGISVNSNGSPRINSAYEAKAYMNAYKTLFGNNTTTNGTINNSSNNTYVSPKKTEVSSGMKYTTKDILNLNGSTVFVVNDGNDEKGENVTVNIDEKLAEIIMTTSNEFNIDPTLIIAVMAHESRFKSDSSSGAASGLMQVNDQYFPTYASENKELIESLCGDYTNIYDEAANIVAWGASYNIWVNTYGDNKDSLKALRQGYIQPDNYPDGWSPNATNNANEFMDIKNELDNMIK